MTYKSTNSDAVINRALEAMPKFAWAVMGILFAALIFLMFSGLDGAFTRVVNAYATRIEKSVEQLENITSRIDNLEAGHNRLSLDLRNLEKRVDTIEAENKQYHKGK